MTIIIKSGFIAAVSAVESFLEANGVSANVEVGWKRRTQQINQGSGGANRVVFTPSADDAGAGGALTPPRFPGQRNVRDGSSAVVANIRALLTWERKALVSVWAVDKSALTSEAAQIEAVEELFEWVVRAVHSAPGAFGSVAWGDASWTVPAERSFGLELRAGLTFSHPIFDQPRTLAHPTGAVARAAYTPPVTPPSTGDT